MKSSRSLCKVLILVYIHVFHCSASTKSRMTLKIGFTREESLKECHDCLLNRVERIRLTPSNYQFIEPKYSATGHTTLPRNKMSFEAGMTHFYAFNVVNFCQKFNKCTTIDPPAISEVKKNDEEVYFGPDATLDKQPDPIKCMLKLREAVSSICKICLAEASKSQFIGELIVMSPKRSQRHTLFVLFSNQTSKKIERSCKSSCGKSAHTWHLSGDHCEGFLRKLLRDEGTKHKFGATELKANLVSSAVESSSMPFSEKDMIGTINCLATQDRKSASHACHRCLVRHFSAPIIVVTTEAAHGFRLKKPRTIIHIVGELKIERRIASECKESCGMVQSLLPDNRACGIQFDDIFSQSLENGRISSKYSTFEEVNATEDVHSNVLGKCIWASFKWGGMSQCAGCIAVPLQKGEQMQVSALSDITSLFKVPETTLMTDIAQCVATNKCDELVVVPTEFCAHEMLLKQTQHTSTNTNARRHSSSNTAGPSTLNLNSHQQSIGIYDKAGSKNVASQNTVTGVKRKRDNLQLDLNRLASTGQPEPEHVVVLHWSSSNSQGCLECLAITDELILISVEKSYAWVINADKNYFAEGWYCPYCGDVEVQNTMLLDVSSLLSISSIKVRKYFPSNAAQDSATSAAYTTLPIVGPGRNAKTKP
uniref:CHXC2 n=1 Tax=Albugo laibachii Nc14 TaxID=890382 RepID=F0WDT9_9STRA|nr:CHXC2 [Albugo laibachii Nc14]|eukprot:CCA19366.1 CHXC2 [Albugo laibachii Nc14]